MGDNLFAGSAAVASVQEKTAAKPGKTAPIDYAEPPSGILFCITSFLIGFAMGFAVLFIYFRIIPLCIAGGAVTGGVYIFVAQNNAVVKRKTKLRAQFYDLLEAVSVSMRAGNPAFKALESAKTDLLLIYAPDSDILVELNIILLKFNNAVPLSEAFSDLAERSGLEDIASFASIYETIEGKSSRADEIVRETQQITARLSTAATRSRRRSWPPPLCRTCRRAMRRSASSCARWRRKCGRSGATLPSATRKRQTPS